jgi:predicted phage terminase large subunit-like protein
VPTLNRRDIDAAAVEWLREALAEQSTVKWQPMPHQVPPPEPWHVWLLEGGRGSGKTDGAAAYVNACAVEAPIRISIIAPTLGDAVESCVNGPSGIKAHNPAVRLTQGMGGVHLRWPNGSEAKLFGAFTPEDVERLRAGGNRHLVWAEELAAWVRLDDAWDQMEFGLRLGEWPRIVASSTPKPRKRYLAIRGDERTIRTGASTMVNPHLAQNVRDALLERYAGTRLGRQELDAEILLDVPGALWTYAMFEQRGAQPDDLARVVVAVDPSGGSDAEADEQGIGVAAKGADGRCYVLADRSCRLSPDGWGRRAVQAYLDFKADRLVYERNFGGDMVEAVIQTAARAMGVQVNTKAVTASRGKRVRAEPIAALYEQGKVTHCEVFPELEEQMTIWTPESGKSPDRLDWLVWALTDLMLTGNDTLEVW